MSGLFIPLRWREGNRLTPWKSWEMKETWPRWGSVLPHETRMNVKLAFILKIKNALTAQTFLIKSYPGCHTSIWEIVLAEMTPSATPDPTTTLGHAGWSQARVPFELRVLRLKRSSISQCLVSCKKEKETHPSNPGSDLRIQRKSHRILTWSKWTWAPNLAHVSPPGHRGQVVGLGFQNGVLVTSSLRRQWHPTPVLLPGKCHGRRSLVGCSPWGR